MPTPTRTDTIIHPATGRLCRNLLMLGALCLSAPCWAQRHGGHRQNNTDTEQTQDIGPAQAARIAQQRHGGQVLKVGRDGQSYLVKLLLPSGTVRTVRIDASGN
jgi:hypothetical protein